MLKHQSGDFILMSDYFEEITIFPLKNYYELSLKKPWIM